MSTSLEVVEGVDQLFCVRLMPTTANTSVLAETLTVSVTINYYGSAGLFFI